MNYIAPDETKMNRFKQTDGDIEYRTYTREFSGRMTKGRWKILDRYCRKHSWSTHCGHEWDCCGCLCGQYASFAYSANQVTVSITQSFNY